MAYRFLSKMIISFFVSNKCSTYIFFFVFSDSHQYYFGWTTTTAFMKSSAFLYSTQFLQSVRFSRGTVIRVITRDFHCHVRVTRPSWWITAISRYVYLVKGQLIRYGQRRSEEHDYEATCVGSFADIGYDCVLTYFLYYYIGVTE